MRSNAGFIVIIICWLNISALTGFSQVPGAITAGQVSSTDSAFTLIHQNLGNIEFKIDMIGPQTALEYLYDLDIDLDGITDFTFHLYTMSSNGPRAWIAIIPSSDARVSEEETGLWDCQGHYTGRLDFGQTIDTAGDWDSGMSYLFNYHWYGTALAYMCGHWKNMLEKYAAVSKIVGQDTLYGWIKLSVPKEGDYVGLTLHECALLKKNPLGIVRTEKARVRVFPNPASEYLHIQTDKPGGFITLMDKFGRVVRTTPLSQSGLQLDISQLAQGTYFLQYHNGASVTRKKCIIW